MLTPVGAAGLAAPYFTLVVVALSFVLFGVVFIISISSGPELPVRWFAAMGLAPGALDWYRPFTYWLLHEHLWHLSLNMLLILAFGAALEGSMKAFRFGAFFLSAAAVTGLTECGAMAYGPYPADGSMVIGASGAADAVVGLFASRYHAHQIELGGTRLRFRVLPFVVLLVLAEIASVGARTSGLQDMLRPPPASWAHLAGFLYGIAVDQVARLLRRSSSRSPFQLVETLTEVESRAWTLEECEDILAADPSNKEALVHLPLLLAEEGEMDRAREAASQAVREALLRERPEEAARRYLALAPYSPESQLDTSCAMVLAVTLATMGKHEEAVRVYQHVISAAEDDVLRNKAALRAALLLLRNSDHRDEAVELLRGVIQRGGDEDTVASARRVLRDHNVPLVT